MALHFLNDRDLDVIKHMIADWRSKRKKADNNSPSEWVEHQAPETYVVLTRPDGIDELQGNRPGYADCGIYRNVDGSLEYAGHDETVYNVSDDFIEGDIFIVATRDKYGIWYAVGPVTLQEPVEDVIFEEETGTGSGTSTATVDTGTGTGGDAGTGTGGTTPGTGTGGGSSGGTVTTGWGTDTSSATSGRSCSLAGLRTTDCLRAIYNDQELILSYLGGVWTSAIPSSTGTALDDISYLVYPGGIGVVEFWFADGRLHLSVGGLELLDCGNGCFSGGALTGHTPNEATGTSSITSLTCSGEMFSVCVECADCVPVETPGTGTGTGTSTAGTGSTGSILNACCPSDLLPDSITMTITSGGSCNGTHVLTYRTINNRWKKNVASIGSCTIDVEVYCHTVGLTSTWTLVLSLSVYNGNGISCDPLHVEFTSVDFGFCGGSSSALVTITE